ncbi:MAG: metal-dependent hydrolase [Pseudomonadales bacterium]
MDPFSQAALGAVVSQAVCHRQLGYRAAAIGALAGALPDIDVLFSVGGDYFDQLVRHRGITHSLLFAPVAGPLLGALVWRIERRRLAGPATDPPAARGRARLRSWMLVVTLALLSHPLLDYLTPYGTQLLLPFSDTRFAINAMPIIDPVYTLLLVLGLLIAGRFWRTRASRVAVGTLLLSSSYLGYGYFLNLAAEREAERQLAASGIHDARVAAFPTILQLHYRRVVARTPDRDRVGFISMWRPCDIAWSDAPRDADGTLPVAAFLATREGRIFDWFSMGWARYRIEAGGGGPVLRATDLRYGFTEDPDRSIFSASAVVDLAGRLVGPVRAGRDAADASGQRLALLFQQTYTRECRPSTFDLFDGKAEG